MREYRDSFDFERRYLKAAWRAGSVEVVEDRVHQEGLRVYKDGRWLIASATSPASAQHYLSQLESRRIPEVERRGAGELAEARLFAGRVELMVPTKDPLEELSKRVMLAGALFIEKGMTGEAVGEAFVERRRISHEEGEALEIKAYSVLTFFAVVEEGARRRVGSSSLAVLGDASSVEERLVEAFVERAARRAYWSLKASAPGVTERGRKTLVLSHEAAASFAHEVSHALNGLYASLVRPDEAVSTYPLSLRDDPLRPGSPAARVFDDEAVVCVRKTLVEDGTVVELLGTRSLRRERSRPGNAFGLSYPPEPFHANLTLGPGDWGDRELVEETKEGFYLDGVVAAELYEGVVTIYPEAAWRVRRGELKEPVAIREVKLPLLFALMNIDAVGRTLERRCGWERGWMVCEESPILRLKGYVF